MSGVVSTFQPITEVSIGREAIAEMMTFWDHFDIPFTKVPGLKELVTELLAKEEGSLTLDDCERLQYLLCYELANSTHEAITDPLFVVIVAECADMVKQMDAYYPGRVWI